MKKYTGIILIVLGALILILSYTLDRFAGISLVDYNFVQLGALILVIVGIVTHIILTKKLGEEQ